MSIVHISCLEIIYWRHYVDFQDSDEASSLDDVIKSLKHFIEQATLGDFHTRLEMLLSFHCNLVTMTTCEEQSVTIATESIQSVTMETGRVRQELQNVMWNMYQFYSRFSGTIQAELDRLRAPLEKELKVVTTKLSL